MTTNNPAQERQDQLSCEIILKGMPNWKEVLTEMTVELSDGWAELCGGKVVPHLTYAKKEAEVNGTSLERSVLIAFLNCGFKLEELEVTIEKTSEKQWGRCVWYQEHPSYRKPIDELFDGTALNDPSLFYAMWKTEHAGDQNFGFYSVQMMASNSILPHKTFVYHRIVLSPPAKTESAAA